MPEHPNHQNLKTIEEISDLLLSNKFIDKPFGRGKFIKNVDNQPSDDLSSGYIPATGNAVAETYGNKTFVYVRIATDKKKSAEKFLKKKGIKIEFYNISTMIEVPIQYFKAKHWDE